MAFLRKQQQVHPDSYAQKSSVSTTSQMRTWNGCRSLSHPKVHIFRLQEEYQLAQTQSSYLNKAYNTLKEPLARAQYMLALNGVEVSESESLEDPELLMEVMEIREEMEEAESEEDIERLKIENTGRYMC